MDAEGAGTDPDPAPDQESEATTFDTAAASQAQINAEIEAAHRAYQQARNTASPGNSQPRLDYAPYRSTAAAAPDQGPAARRPGDDRAVGAVLRRSATCTRSSPT